MFSYENCLVYPFHVSDKKLQECMDLFLTKDKNRSQDVYIEDLRATRENIRRKNTFVDVCSALAVKVS